MSYLKHFKQIKLDDVAGALVDGELWFFGEDVAQLLKYPIPRKALKQHVDIGDTEEIAYQDDKGRWMKGIIINESGVFSLIFSSQLPATKDFKRWIAKEVLPQIRKTGGYNTLSAEDNEKTNPANGEST